MPQIIEFINDMTSFIDLQSVIFTHL